jgi:hypothetical protein
LDHITVTPLLGSNASLYISNPGVATNTATAGSVSQVHSGSSSPTSGTLAYAAAAVGVNHPNSSSLPTCRAVVGHRLGSTSVASKPSSIRHRASSSSATATGAAAVPAGSWAAAASTGASAGVMEGPTFLFPCNAWLDERLGDGTTERKLYASR